MAKPTTENYLKNVWKFQEAGRRATTSTLAERLGVAPATVTAQVKRLAAEGLLRHEPYGAIELTEEGARLALRVIRKHRLWELFLVRVLDFPLHLVDAEAEKMEHILSEELESCVDRHLGHPTRDPHGHPIPSGEGRLDRVRDLDLSEIPAGSRARVVRVSDGDPDLLEYLTGLGFGLGAELQVIERKPFGGPIRVRIGGREEFLGPEAAESVAVVPLEGDDGPPTA